LNALLKGGPTDVSYTLTRKYAQKQPLDQLLGAAFPFQEDRACQDAAFCYVADRAGKEFGFCDSPKEAEFLRSKAAA
jgi:hypothetical protein